MTFKFFFFLAVNGRLIHMLRLPCVVICGTALPSAGSGVLKTVVDVRCVTIVRKNASVMCIGFLSCRD